MNPFKFLTERIEEQFLETVVSVEAKTRLGYFCFIKAGRVVGIIGNIVLSLQEIKLMIPSAIRCLIHHRSMHKHVLNLIQSGSRLYRRNIYNS